MAKSIVTVSAGDDCGALKGSAATTALYEKGCKGGDAESCLALSHRYRCGVGVERDVTKAATLAEDACEKGANACATASMINIERGDMSRAARYAQIGCDRDDTQSCNNLGLLYLKGEGVQADPVRSAKLFEKLCTGGNTMSCANLALQYWKGLGVVTNLARAQALAEGACAKGNLAGCNTLGGVLLDVGGDEVKRVPGLFDRSCQGGDAGACDNLGQVLSRGPPAYRDRDRAAGAFKRACDMNFAKACRHLAELQSE